MPRKKNLDIAAELGEEIDVTEEQANAAREIVETPAPIVAPVAAAPMAPITLTFEQLQTLLASNRGDSANGAAIADAITQGIQQTKGKHQNETAPGVSVFNPLGDRDHPRPGLKCKMTLATQNAKTKVVRETYPYEDDDLTAHEQVALNTLEPWQGVVTLLDGAPIKVSLIPTYNQVDDTLEKLAIVIPAKVTEKGSHIKNMLPSICNLVEQITGHNYAKLSNDDLAWFMAEHRARRFVNTREQVAA